MNDRSNFGKIQTRHCGLERSADLRQNRLRVRLLWQCRITYAMFIQSTIERDPSGFSGYIWPDSNNCFALCVLKKSIPPSFKD